MLFHSFFFFFKADSMNRKKHKQNSQVNLLPTGTTCFKKCSLNIVIRIRFIIQMMFVPF